MEKLLSENGYICDANGGVYHSAQILDGVTELVNWMMDNNKEVVFFTNTPEKPYVKLTLTVCEEKNISAGDKYGEVVEKIKAYIDKNYADVNINVFAISNELQISRAYVSRIYREYTNERILDTIHKKRIEKAIEMLRDGKSVKYIAEKVGYLSSTRFIKAFKKYMGITPGQYKRT